MKYNKLPYLAKLILAVIFAPILGDIVVLSAYSIWMRDALGMFIIGLNFAYPTTLFLGLPYHLVLRYFGKQHFVLYFIGGFVIGTGVLMVMFTEYGFAPFVFVNGGVPGGIIAVIARWIVGGIEPSIQSQKPA